MLSFCDHLAKQRPDEIAVRDARAKLDWAQLDWLLNRIAHGLLDADLGPERRLAVFAHNSIETGAVHVAGLLAGATWSAPTSCASSRQTSSLTCAATSSRITSSREKLRFSRPRNGTPWGRSTDALARIIHELFRKLGFQCE